ncbi:MAG: hypothetical protein M3141_02435 [Actinomycetota bacterium]|nr:hypothetical protein [Actinomycetota bacterium]
MTRRDRIVVLVVVAALGVGGFFMLVLKPKRDEAAKLASQVEVAQTRVETAQASVAAGQRARATYAANYATVARLGKAVPTDDDIPSLVFQLDSTAEATGVDFRSVKLESGSGSAAQAATQTAAAAAASNSDQASQDKEGDEEKDAPASGTPAAPAPATQAAAAALPPGAVVGEAGLSKMPFSFAFEGSFFKLSSFLTRIERYIKPRAGEVHVRGRLLLVDGIALTAAQNGFPNMKASIVASAYLLPVSQGLFDGATPEGPSAATTAPAQPVADGSGGGASTPSAAVTP